MRRKLIPVLWVALAQSGCSGGASHVDRTNVQTDGPVATGTAGSGSVAQDPTATDVPLVIDQRPALSLSDAPPPISGGTLLIASDGLTAVAADPDRDRVSVVDLRSGTVTGEIALRAGDEPGRLVQDGQGRVHVVLRGSGELATLDVTAAKLLARRPVCAAPRGVAYDADADVLHVACMDGELVTLAAAGGAPLQSMHVTTDLRDVIVQGGRMFVSQFKSASLLELDASGEVLSQATPSTVERSMLDVGTFESQARSFQPAVARRAIAMSNGRVLMLHQREMTDPIQLQDVHDPASMQAPDGNGSVMVPSKPGAPGAGSAYGGGDACQSIVQTALSVVEPDGTVMQSASLIGSVLPVDVALSSDGKIIAVANAGQHDPQAPLNLGAGVVADASGRPASVPPGTPLSGFGPSFASTAVDMSQPFGLVNLVSADDPSFAPGDPGAMDACVSNTVAVPGQPTSVAFTPDGTLVVQSREPAALIVLSSTSTHTIALGGASRLDTGHDLFHRDAGAGIACASCHAEGGDDGHVWQFSGLGPRRTQSVDVGLAGTAPFHWAGDMKDFPMLVNTVLVGRMGGVAQSPQRVTALSSWLFSQEPPARIRAAGDAAALRGKALFDSDEVGCSGCHSGDKFTDNKSVDVGTGGVFQVPSLVGIGYRAPFLHDGCAATLRQRFDPDCGGTEHGHTQQLDEAQLGDLIAYLESL